MRASREAYPAKPCTAGTMEHLTDMDALALVTGITLACKRAEYLHSLFPLPPGRIERATHGEGHAPSPTPIRQQRVEEDAAKACEAEARAGRAMAQTDRVLEQNERLIAKRENLQKQAEIHAQEARTANATIHEIYQLCTGATGEPGNWNGAEPVRRIVNELREARQALRDVRPEIDSLIAGLYRSHVEPSSGIVHDEDVAHEISQLTELHERIVRLITEREPQSSGVDNLLREMEADIDSMSDEEIRAESSPGDAEEVRRVVDAVTAHPTPEQRFGHHADPVIDFCVEVECMESIAADWRLGLRPYSELQPRLARALEFRVGGNESALLAKDRLRVLEQSLTDAPAEKNGDALAALMQIVRAHVDSQDDAIAADQCEEEIRRHLTASGVPEQPGDHLEPFLDHEHEITSYPERPPHGNWPDEWDEKPFARIKWAEDGGDPSVGMPGWRGFCLTEDQSGTVLGDLITGDEQTGDALAALNREIDTQEINVVGRNQMGGCMPPSYRAKLRTICESDGAVYLPVEELSELLDAFDELEARHLTASGVLGNCMYCDKPVRLREQAERHFSHATCEQSEREFAEVMEGEKMQPCMGDFMRRIHELGIRDPSEIAKAASGVPYVPEPILELPDKWFHRADDNALPYSEARREQLRVDAGELRYEMQKALASAPADGWKLVPVEPTPDMWKAGYDAYDRAMLSNRRNVTVAEQRKWRAMIAAAPTHGG